MEADSTQSTELYLKWLAWFHANRTKVLAATITLIILAIVAGVMAWQRSEAQTEASAQLFSVPLAVANGNQITPVSSSALLDVAQKYPDTTAGEYADLLGAESLFLEGKYADSEHAFSKFVEAHPSSDLLPQAKVGVAASLEAQGKLADAGQKYQEIVVSYPTDANIAEPAKLTLARIDEEQNKPEQALTYYEELARVNNPYDPWAGEARERGSLLLAHHPELRKAPPSATHPPAGGMKLPGLDFSAPPPSQPSSVPSNTK